ncbi:MAG: hypothetical protein J6X30_01985, partial [Clostridia bacterium]|nr:hypothetical protein [Clostridia bacterium]
VYTCVPVFGEPEEHPIASNTEAQSAKTGAAEEEGVPTVPGQAFNPKVDNEKDYSSYQAKYAGVTEDVPTIELLGENAVEFDASTGESKGNLPLVKVKPDNDPTDERQGAVFYDEGICGWVFNVPKTGLYSITVSYFAYDELTYEKDGVPVTAKSKSSAIQRRLYLDYTVPFYEARQIEFTRAWRDAGLLHIDQQTQNEKRPYQTETAQWLTADIRDYMGYEEEALRFYLTAGTHVLALEAVKEGMVVQKAVLHRVESAPTYAELVQSYAAAGYQRVSDVEPLIVQAEGLHQPDTYIGSQADTFLTTKLIEQYENYISPMDTTAYDATKDVTYTILKSSPTLYAITDRSSPVSVPYHHSKIRYNTIGADKWENPNEWIRWTVQIEKAGLYAITFKARQNTLNGMYTSRKLTINGELPCKEAGKLRFRYSNNFSNYTLGDDTNGTYYFYFHEGTNTIQLETTLGDLVDLLA